MERGARGCAQGPQGRGVLLLVCGGMLPPGRRPLRTPLPEAAAQAEWGPRPRGGRACLHLGVWPFREGARARAPSRTRLVRGVGCCPCWEGRVEGTCLEMPRVPSGGGGAWPPGDSTDTGALAEGGRRALSLCPAGSLGLHSMWPMGGRRAWARAQGAGGRAGSHHAVLRSGHQPLHRRAAPHRVLRQDLTGEAALLDPHAGRRARPAAVR